MCRSVWQSRRFSKAWQRSSQQVASSALVLAIVLLGFALRVVGLSQQSLWFDEAFSVRLADTDFLSVAARVTADPHPPLYFWLLNLWMAVAGQSEFAVRLLSALMATATLPAIHVVATRCLGARRAWLATLLAAVAPFYVYYAQETRMYALLALAATLSAYAFLRLVEQPSSLPISALYVLCSTAAVYSHYYGLFVVLSGDLFLVWLLLGRHLPWANRSAYLKSLLGAQLFIGLLYLPWAWGQAYRLTGYASQTAAAFGLDSLLWQIAVAFPLGHSIERYNAVPGDARYWPDHQAALALAIGPTLLVVVAIGSLLASASGWRAEPTDANRVRAAERWFPVFWLLASIALVYLVSLGQRDFTARYLIAAAPAYHLLLAGGIHVLRRLQPALALFAGCLVLASSAVALWNYYFDPYYARDDQPAAVRYVADHAASGEAVVLNAAYQSPVWDYYYRGSAELAGIPRRHPADEAETELALADLIRRHDFVWLVLWQDYFSDPNRYVESYLNRHALPARAEVFHGNIKVRGYRTRSAILSDLPRDAKVVGQNLGGEVELAGYRLAERIGRNGELEVDLYWRALRPPSKDYTAFVHLLDPSGQVIAQADSPPALGTQPSRTWSPGSVIEDYHRIAIPAFSPPGDYTLAVGLYDPSSGDRLGQTADRIEVGPLALSSGSQEYHIARRVDVDFGPLRLLGYEMPENQQGRSRRIDLFWQANARLPNDLRAFVHLLDPRGERVAQDDGIPARGAYPLDRWAPGQVVRDPRNLSLPAAMPSQYRLAVGLYRAEDGTRIPFRKWPWSRQETLLVLAEVSAP